MKLNRFLLYFELIFASIFVLLFCLHFLPSEENFIRIHDTFDGNFSTRHVLIKSQQFFQTDPKTIVPGIMNGLPRGVFPKFTDIGCLLMYFFGSIRGFALSFLLIRLIGFFGFYFFVRDHIGFTSEHKGLVILVSVAFAALPVFIMYGITVMGIPLVFWAFFNLLEGNKKGISFFIFIFFTLWGNFVLVGIHLLIFFAILFVWYSFRNKKVIWPIAFAIFILLAGYLLSEYMLFYTHWFNSSYQSARGSFEKQLGLNFNGVIGNTVELFFTGNYSAAGYFGYLFIPLFLFLPYSYLRNRNDFPKKAFFILISITSISFLVSLLDWKSASIFYEKFPLANDLSLKRFFNLLPAAFFFLVVISCIVFSKWNLYSRMITTFLVVILLIFIWRGNVSYAFNSFNTTGWKIVEEQKMTFNQFFDPPLYQKIKLEIGSDTLNNIVHLGLSPSPSKFAGLNVLDDYQGDYPKEYKAKFRKIIEGELNKSEKYRNYFDEWGIRCYIYSAGYFIGKVEYLHNTPYETELSIDTKQIKEMNANYILSGYIIGNANALNLKLEKVFVSHYDFKKILLYKINIS